MPPPLINLNVSGRKYVTRPSTLATSPYFTALLARWNSSADLEDDGSYFIDADPDVFEHILAFMRRPSKFPLYWTQEHGFDYVLYNKVEAEADFFLLHGLRDWVRGMKYKEAVKSVMEVKVLSGRDSNIWIGGGGSCVEVTGFFGAYDGNRRPVFACPLHLPQYAMNCELCKELVGKHGAQFAEPDKQLTLVIKKVVFDERVCRNDGVAN
jgi:hypothetical protein